jgi:hypothetical protein
MALVFSLARTSGRACRWCWPFCLLVLALGCKPRFPTEFGDISGKVYFKDEILPGGTITFVTEEGGFSNSGTIAPDGTYHVEKVPAGEVKVMVDNRMLEEHGGAGRMPSLGPRGMPNAKKMEGTYVKIPATYHSSQTTPLTYTVTVGKQTHDVKMVPRKFKWQK